MASFAEDFTRDIPRGLSSRYLKQQTAPQARWQTPEVILERKALEYDPRNPGGKISSARSATSSSGSMITGTS